MENSNLENGLSDPLVSNVSEVTTVDVFPAVDYSKIQLSSQITNALIQKNPETVLEIVQANQRQQREAQEQQHELALLKLKNYQEISLKKEERKIQGERTGNNLIYAGIVSFIAIFSGVLVYSAKVGDRTLPSTIFTAAMSAIAGGGVVLAKGNKSETEVIEEPSDSPDN